MKKLLTILCAVVCACCFCFSMVGCSEEPITYTKLANGTYEVTKVNIEGTTVEIPATYKDAPVTAIGENVFMGSAIEKVVLPASVKNIGASAFKSCKKLQAINLGKVETIGVNAFNGAGAKDKLTELDLTSVKTLSNGAFSGCEYLKKVTFSENLTEIPAKAFSSCTLLSTVKGITAVKNIGTSAFSGCSLLSNMDFSKIEYIADEAFSSCVTLSEIDMQSIVELGIRAFQSCTSLYEVTIGANCVKFYKQTFYGCTSLKYINLVDPTNWYSYGVNSNDPSIIYGPNKTNLDVMSDSREAAKAIIATAWDHGNYYVKIVD